MFLLIIQIKIQKYTFIPPGNIFFSVLQDAQKTMYESYYSRSKSSFEVTSHNHKKAQTTTDKARTPPTRPISLGTLPESPSTPSSSHLSAQQRLWLTHWSPAPQAEHGKPWG